MITQDPIGGLLLAAEKHSLKKASRYHEAIAPCGCLVTVHWFSPGSRWARFERCPEHPKERYIPTEADREWRG